MEFEELVTERLRLRKLVPETFQYIHAHFSDEELMAFLGLKSEEELLLEREKYKKGLWTYNRSFCNFILLDKETGEIAGSCGYHTWYTEHRRAEVGYSMNEAFKQKGLMSEALAKIIDYGFRTLNLNRIEALIGQENVASRKLLEKNHFVWEGVLREHYAKNGTIEDSIMYSLLRKDHEPA